MHLLKLITACVIGTSMLLLTLAFTFAVGPVVHTAQAACTQTSVSKDMKVGSKINDVSTVQAFLVGRGYLTMPAGVGYGYFGPATKNAVIKYQKSVGLTAEGFVGPLTRAQLNRDMKNDCGATVSKQYKYLTLLSPETGTYAAGGQLKISFWMPEDVSSNNRSISVRLDDVIYLGNAKSKPVILSTSLPTSPKLNTVTLNIPTDIQPGTYQLVLCLGCNDGSSISLQQEAASSNIVIVNNARMPKITILSPNGGERYTTSDIMHLTWTSSDMPSDRLVFAKVVRADYNSNVANITQDYCNLQDVCPKVSKGSLDYIIPSSIPTGTYKVIIQCWNNSNSAVVDCDTKDISDSAFTITNSGIIGYGQPACPSFPCTFDGKALRNSWGTVDSPTELVSAQYPYEFTIPQDVSSRGSSVKLRLRSQVWPSDPAKTNTMTVKVDDKTIFTKTRSYDQYAAEDLSGNSIDVIDLGTLSAGKHYLKIEASPYPSYFHFDWFSLE